MILKMPKYYDKFKCIADKCTDNCCIGWEIEVDSSTNEFYHKVTGEFGKKLRENIKDGCFILGEDERCPFLNSKNLCEIIINSGEENLCQICRDHPRYFEWYDGIKEGGIGLGCEEAARIILSQKSTLTFSEKEIPYESNDSYDKELYDVMYKAREMIFKHLQNKEISLGKRIGDVLIFSDKLQNMVDNYIYKLPSLESECDKVEINLKNILSDIATLDPIDEKWSQYIDEVVSVYDDVSDEKLSTDNADVSLYLENIALYFIWRYFLKGVFTGEFLSYVKVMAVSIAVIEYFFRCFIKKNGYLSFENCVDIVKNYSKQVEYSEENMENLRDFSYEKSEYDTQGLAFYLKNAVF